MNLTDETCGDVRDALRSQAERVESTAPSLDFIRQLADQAPVTARVSRPRLKVGLAAGLAVITVGGAAAAIGNPWPRSADYRADDRSSALSAAVSDQQVTLDEYKAGFDRYLQCATAAGVVIYDLAFDDATTLYNFSTSGGAADEDCYVSEFYALDVAWQLDTNRPGYAAADARQQLEAACAIGGPVQGFPYDGDQLDELCDRLRELQQADE